MNFMHSALVVLQLAVVSAPPSQGQQVIPNDPLFPRQVSFLNPGGTISLDVTSRRPSERRFSAEAGIDLNITRAWSITTGSPGVVVAVIDDGFFAGHEDLKSNIWRNTGESGTDEHGYAKEANGIDDDGNGYIDDVVGWDFAFDDPNPDGYAFDGMDATRIQPYTHGNPSLGIIGAVGNNGVGVTGINWRVSLMLLKAGAQGTPRHMIDSRRIDRSAKAIRYASDNGARVISWSQFISDHRPARLAVLKDAIDYAEARGVLIVVAAGNETVDIDIPENAFYPACFSNNNLLVVAEVDLTGRLDRNSGRNGVSGSSWGAHNVDIAAVARNYTTDVFHGQSTYRIGGGTSHATPVVAGVAALCLAVNPDLDAASLKEIIVGTARPLPNLAGKVACGGMVDAWAAVKSAKERRR